MLSWTFTHHPDDVADKLKSFNPQKETWIVSDLKSKQEIQKIAIHQQKYYSDESVLRISDFWKMWIRRFCPHLQIVSSDFIKELVKNYIEIYGEKLALEKQEASTLYKYMTDLAPLVLHEQSHQTLKEWIKSKKPEPQWMKWEIVAQNCLQYIIQTHHCLESSWVSAYLQNQPIEKIIWPNKIIFDLGSKMTSLEMGLIQILAQKNEIEVIVPRPPENKQWHNKFNYLLKTYQNYSGFGKVAQEQIKRTQDLISHIKSENFYRFASEVSEVKFVTHQVRKYIESGVKPDSIVILSPRIEDYWPLIKFHFDEEGIPLQKDLVSSAMSLGLVQKWLSAIQVKTQKSSWEDLEFTYSQTPQAEKNFEQFKALFQEMFDAEDLKRSAEIQKNYYAQIDLYKKISRDQFLFQLLKSWIQIDFEKTGENIIPQLTKDFISQTIETELYFNQWFELLQSRLSKKELKIENSKQHGVHVLPVNSAQIFNITHRLWIGLDDSGFKSQHQTLLPISDIEELKSIFDLSIDYPEESHSDFNLRWYAMSECKEQIFTSAHVSNLGEPLNVSLFFLEHCKEADIEFDYNTMVDSEQRFFNPDSLLKNEPVQFNKLKIENNNEHHSIQQFKFDSLSPSDIETYAKCEFKLLAAKGFKLRQYQVTGVDIDARQKGTVLHDLFKFIIADKNYLSVTKSEIDQYLEEQRIQKKLFPLMDLFWLTQKNKMIDIGFKFSQVEKQRLAMTSDVSHHLEQTVEVYFNLEDLQFEKQQSEKKSAEQNQLKKMIKIKGRLDRFDLLTQENSFILFDYKSAKNSGTHMAKSWLKYNEYQLLLYSLCIEKAYGYQALGALYYFYKNYEHHTGYVLDQDFDYKKSLTLKKNTSISKDDLAVIKSEFTDQLKKLFDRLLENHFKTNPLDEKECQNCDWRKLCRAPHLN